MCTHTRVPTGERPEQKRNLNDLSAFWIKLGVVYLKFRHLTARGKKSKINHSKLRWCTFVSLWSPVRGGLKPIGSLTSLRLGPLCWSERLKVQRKKTLSGAPPAAHEEEEEVGWGGVGGN